MRRIATSGLEIHIGPGQSIPKANPIALGDHLGEETIAGNTTEER